MKNCCQVLFLSLFLVIVSCDTEQVLMYEDVNLCVGAQTTLYTDMKPYYQLEESDVHSEPVMIIHDTAEPGEGGIAEIQKEFLDPEGKTLQEKYVVYCLADTDSNQVVIDWNGSRVEEFDFNVLNRLVGYSDGSIERLFYYYADGSLKRGVVVEDGEQIRETHVIRTKGLVSSWVTTSSHGESRTDLFYDDRKRVIKKELYFDNELDSVVSVEFRLDGAIVEKRVDVDSGVETTVVTHMENDQIKMIETSGIRIRNYYQGRILVKSEEESAGSDGDWDLSSVSTYNNEQLVKLERFKFGKKVSEQTYFYKQLSFRKYYAGVFDGLIQRVSDLHQLWIIEK